MSGVTNKRNCSTAQHCSVALHQAAHPSSLRLDSNSARILGAPVVGQVGLELALRVLRRHLVRQLQDELLVRQRLPAEARTALLVLSSARDRVDDAALDIYIT